MIIKLIIIVLVVLVVLAILRNKNAAFSGAWKKIGSILFLFFTVIAVMRPSITDSLAELVGVGRGADLLLYTLTLLFLGTLFGQYSYNKREQVNIHRLARKIAINEAMADGSNTQKLNTSSLK